MQPRLYLDNAATSFPKPPAVIDAMRRYSEELGASAGRGAYREAMETGGLLAECRLRLARLINAENATHVVFTLNCSEALNLAIKGLLRPNDHVVTTRMEHNSVLRPLHALREERGIGVTFVAADCRTGQVSARDIVAAVRDDTRLIIMQHASNVTGAIQPVEDVGVAARERGVIFLVDAAQTAGHVAIDVRKTGIDLLATPGHKGLLGPLGTGALYIRPGLEDELQPLMQGGTGSISDLPTQPDFMPDKFESGSHNAIGLAGLEAALRWIEHETVPSLAAHGRAMSARFLDRVAELDGVTVFGPSDPAQRVAVFGLRIAGLEPAEAAAVLEAEFAILARSGLQCAPWAHETLGTLADGGTTRLSFGAFNTLEDVDRSVEALARLCTTQTRA